MSGASDGAGVRYVVAGAGGMGHEALAWARDAWPAAEVLGFWVAPGGPSPVGAGVGLPVVDSFEAVHDAGATHVVLGIGDNRRRRAVAEEVAVGGLEPLTIVHPTAFLGPGVTVGQGAIVAPGVVLTRGVEVGPGAVVNYRAAVGHGCRIGPWAFLGPAAALAGDITIGEGALVGIGAVILPGRVVGAGATVAGGAVVIADVPGGATMAGNPARPIG